MAKKINVTVWNEDDGSLERDTQEAYPERIHNAIAAFLKDGENIGVLRTATMQQPENGLPQEILDDTDVMIWWSHLYHDMVSDEVVERVRQRVLAGMGLITLHSAHGAKILRVLLGTNNDRLRWRENNERERVWVIEHSHPIMAGIGDYIEIPQSETYGEHFGIPAPDELLTISWYEGGEVFRSGCTWKRGSGKIFYFSPGHESYRIYDMPEIQKVIKNAVAWAAPVCYPEIPTMHHPKSPEEIFKEKYN